MPLLLRIPLGSLLVLVGVALLVIAVLAHRRRLPRNRFAGVRTAATLRSDEAFARGNRAAAPLLAAAGTVGVVTGCAVLAGGPPPAVWTVFALGFLGTVVLTGIGGVVGDRIAVATPGATTAGCAGGCPGCDRAAGCRDGQDEAAAAASETNTTT